MGDPGQEGPGGAGDRLLAWRSVREIVGLSRTTAWRLQQRGAFPLPLQISPGRVAWWESELNAWKAARLRAVSGREWVGSKAPARMLRPPREPRLFHTARALPAASPARAVLQKPPDEPEDERSDPSPAPAVRPSRRRRPKVHPGQIDFGF